MRPKIGVEFRITGHDLQPPDITQIVGLVPTRTWLEGESIQGTKLRRRHNGWCLSLKNGADVDDLNDGIRDLLRVLLTKADQINQVCADYQLDSEMSCVVRMRDEAPAISLGQETIAGMSRIHAALDIDVILVSELTRS